MQASKEATDWEDQQVAEDILSGDMKTYKKFYERFSKIIYAACLSFCHDENEADDLLNEIMIKLLITIGRYDPGKGRLAAWVNRVAMNFLKDYYKKSKEEPEIIPYEIFIFDLYPGKYSAADCLDETVCEEKYDDDPDIDKLNKALLSISSRDRNILQYRANGLSYENISEFLGIKINTAMTAYCRALKKVREKMKGER